MKSATSSIVLVALLICPVLAQQSFLLPNKAIVSGTVVDENGKPLAGAQIWHALPSSEDSVVSEDGMFHFMTQAPAFVVRKPGYQSVYVDVSKYAQALHIVLKATQETLPFCSDPPPCLASGERFCFPKIVGVRSGKTAHDIDYIEETYTPQGFRSKTYLGHGVGPLWSLGVPDDRDVWSSVDYSERTYQVENLTVTDARGKTAGGRMWRYLGIFGESAAYYDADQASATLFDRMLDGVCVLPKVN